LTPSRSSLRPATDADVGTLLRLRATWTYENQGVEADPVIDPAYEDAFERWWEQEKHQRLTWLADVDAEPVGMLNMLVFTRMPSPGRVRSQWGYVANMFVLAEHRHAGLGRALLDAAIGYADRYGFVRLVLSPSPRSVPFYERAGFAPATSLMVRPAVSR